jgi:hypothetical protein
MRNAIRFAREAVFFAHFRSVSSGKINRRESPDAGNHFIWDGLTGICPSVLFQLLRFLVLVVNRIALLSDRIV